MRITVRRFVSPYSARSANDRQEVSFELDEVREAKPAINSHWLEEPLLTLVFEDQTTMTVSQKEYFEVVIKQDKLVKERKNES